MSFSPTVQTFHPDLTHGKVITLGVQIPNTTSYTVVKALVVERVTEQIIRVVYVWEGASTGYTCHEITLNDIETSHYLIHEILA
jgi:hypothetical protein